MFKTFFRVIDAQTNIPLRCTHEESEVKPLIDKYVTSIDVYVDGYEPGVYEDEIVGRMPFMNHFGGMTVYTA